MADMMGWAIAYSDRRLDRRRDHRKRQRPLARRMVFPVLRLAAGYRGALYFAVAQVPRARRSTLASLGVFSPPDHRVSPAVAYHEASREIDVPELGCLGQHARSRLAARASFAVIVRAHADVIERELALNPAVHLVDGRKGLKATSDVQLVVTRMSTW